MCTLIIGRGVLGEGTLIVAANRDERPDRASDGPGLLHEQPSVVGGRDREGGGTWLAVREGRAVVALLNRRDPGAASANGRRRSRGLLALDVAATPPLYALELDPAGERRELVERIRAVGGPGLGGAALCRAFAALWEHDYVFDVAGRLKRELEAHTGARVFMTLDDASGSSVPSMGDAVEANRRRAVLTTPHFLRCADV